MSNGVVAIIPARGGSTRIPRKNARAFNGRPMIAWPLEACSASEAVSRIIVSTEDAELAQIARESGVAEVINRPPDLASDTSGTAPVIKHAIDELGLGDDAVVMCIYPTATLTSDLIGQAIEISSRHLDRFVISVGRHRSPHERSLQRTTGGLMKLEFVEHMLTRTQELPQRHFDAGKLYVARSSVWKAQETMMEEPFVPFYLPDWAAVDIDEPDDWVVAEALHRVFALESS